MGNKIKYYRLKKHIKLTDLAIASNVSIGYLSHLEHGTRQNPSYIIMKSIANSLNESISNIFE